MRDLPVDPGTGLTNFRRYTWWSLIGVTAFFLVFSVRSRITDPAVPVAVRLAAVAALTVTVSAIAVSISRRLPRVPFESRAVANGNGPSPHPGPDPAGWAGRPPVTWLVAGAAGAAVLGGILLALRDFGLWSFGPAMMVSIVAMFSPAGRRWLLIAAAAAVAAVLGGVTAAVSGQGLLFAAAFPAGLVVFSGWVTLGMLWAWDVAERLNAARRLSAELAVKDERLRFAADLHDIQGHHLQVIALKSELAARLAQADPARAAEEMKEVRRLATDALRDTRAVVQGYRRVTLEEEIANATKVLAAAGIDARMELDPAAAPDLLPDPGRRLLGLVMREATTNVVRHSRARHAKVGYRIAGGLACLRISNDGARPPSTPGPAPTTGPSQAADRSTASHPATATDPGTAADPGTATRLGAITDPGTGLRGLAERLRAAGGELSWRHDGDQFVVAASLPVQTPGQEPGTDRPATTASEAEAR
ncbi:two-component system sensor histidine kinase DesK [Nonomuraea polychroma]|uniref:Two-component system sensor histidine kinase DesK n=1 Tax=Nonomuraea polychroma TaxID=46176 RepID=A0A438M7B3_9ACTN|nr:histidine kinase [Nonomuraea polychroma]RVX41587.1 two-component system sensor histidine kinase DesK [Nonomuraea polychroma]